MRENTFKQLNERLKLDWIETQITKLDINVTTSYIHPAEIYKFKHMMKQIYDLVETEREAALFYANQQNRIVLN